MKQASFFTQAPPAPRPAEQLKGCSLIYQPKGRAREYAALACNVYRGCDHACDYCYGPSATQRTRADFCQAGLRPNFLPRLYREAAKYEAAGITGPVLLSFTCDPYQRLDVEHQVTRETIRTLKAHGLRVHVLTKGGSRALRDLDLFGPGDAFATTLTNLPIGDQTDHWEPNAAPHADRVATIKAFRQAGIPTWVSLEPVIFGRRSLEAIVETRRFVDVFKVGKLNHDRHATRTDWAAFASDTVDLLRSYGYTRNEDPDGLQAGDFYVKRDLAAYLPGVIG